MKTKSPGFPFALLVLFLAVLLGGCTSTHVKQGDLEFIRHSVLTKQNIGKIHVNPKTGDVQIEGYSNEQTEIAAAVAGSVAKALAPAK